MPTSTSSEILELLHPQPVERRVTVDGIVSLEDLDEVMKQSEHSRVTAVGVFRPFPVRAGIVTNEEIELLRDADSF